MKKHSILFLSLLLAVSVYGQQQVIFTNYLLNQYYYNPALPGSEDVHKANLGYRHQWAGFEGSPVTLHANFYGSYNNMRKHGYGLSVVSDRSGLVQNTNFHLNYAYHINLTDSIRMGFGVRPGFMQYNIKLYDAQLADPIDEVLTGNILATNAIDIGSGIYIYSHKFFFSASMRHMLGKSVSFTGFNYGLAKHYTLIAGYNFSKPKSKLEIQPSVLFQYVDPLPMQFNFMLKAVYNKKIWGGLTMRTQDAVGVVLGVNLWGRLSVGYGFDYSLGEIRLYNQGTHELMISFTTTKNRPTLDEEDEDLNKGIFEENNKKRDE
jgi:type IX secretion system PorP/SprF family membrane protein